MDVLCGPICHTHPCGSEESSKGQLKLQCHLGGNDWNACPSVQKGKVRVLSKMSNVAVGVEDRVVRS